MLRLVLMLVLLFLSSLSLLLIRAHVQKQHSLTRILDLVIAIYRLVQGSKGCSPK